MGTDNLSLDDLEKLAGNPDLLFNGRRLLGVTAADGAFDVYDGYGINADDALSNGDSMPSSPAKPFPYQKSGIDHWDFGWFKVDTKIEKLVAHIFECRDRRLDGIPESDVGDFGRDAGEVVAPNAAGDYAGGAVGGGGIAKDSHRGRAADYRVIHAAASDCTAETCCIQHRGSHARLRSIRQ